MYRLKHLGYATASYISAIVEQEKASIEKSENSENQDRSKGAMEQDKQRPNSHTGMDGHLKAEALKTLTLIYL